MLDEDDVTETEALIGFVATCRNYASELAINEVTQRTFNELQQYLDTGTRTLLDALRVASDAERAFRQSQVDAAVRFCAKVFGQEYAAMLAKAAEVAAHDPSARPPRPDPRLKRRAAGNHAILGLAAGNCARLERIVFCSPATVVKPSAMTLWLILALMTAAAIFAVLWPLSRRAPLRSGSDVAVYRDQLEEIERDRAGGPDRRARGGGRARRGFAPAARGG